MKAEHRKELQTNVLADRMGKLVQGVQKQSMGFMVMVIVGGLALVLIAFLFFFRYLPNRGREASDLWVEFEDGANTYINKLVEGPDWIRLSKQAVKEDQFGKTPQGTAARFQNAWFFLWERSLLRLASDPEGALMNMSRAEIMYNVLAEQVKDHPVYYPEALYNLAVIEETKAVQDKGDGKDRAKYLGNAYKMFDELAEKHGDSAHGRLAGDRAKLLKKDSPTYETIARFYKEFQETHKIQPPRKDLQP